MTTITVLTKIKKDQGHKKTKVILDWDDIDRDQLMLLAQARICQRLQWEWERDGKVPEEVYVRAEDFVMPNEEPIDFSKYAKPVVKLDDDWQRLLDGMPEDERKQLIKQLEELR